MLKNVDVASLKTQPQALGEHQVAADAREVIERLQSEVKFQQAKIDALNFELARLKQWRFGKSSESLDAQGLNPQAQLFDAKTEALLVEEVEITRVVFRHGPARAHARRHDGAEMVGQLYLTERPDYIMYVKAHKELQYLKVVNALDILSRNGVRVAALITEQTPNTESLVESDRILGSKSGGQ